MDLESQVHWEEYSKVKEDTLARTHSPDAPGWFVQTVDRNGRGSVAWPINWPRFPMATCQKPKPDRIRHPDHERRPVPAEMFVSDVYRVVFNIRDSGPQLR